MCRKCGDLHIFDTNFVEFYTFSILRYTTCGIFIIPFVPILLYQISQICYTICSFYGYKEPHPTLFKDTEYGLDNPPDNHKYELYETYQYVAAKHNYQDSA